MKRYTTVDDYINGFEQYKKELVLLRKIILATGLNEAVKWGAPVYTHKGKNIVGFAAFKSYFGLWFFQGGLLNDSNNVLINSQEGTTKALRQWRFNSIDEINTEIINDLIAQAVKNEEAGIKIKPTRNKVLSIPPELKNAFSNDAALKEAFDKFTPGKQREFADHVSIAKQEATKLKRIEKIKPLITSGVGLHDKYKNC